MSRPSPRPCRILDRDMPQPLSITESEMILYIVFIDMSRAGTVSVLACLLVSVLFFVLSCLVRRTAHGVIVQ